MVVRLPGCPFFGVFFCFWWKTYFLSMKLTSPHISFNKCLCFVCFKGEKSQGFAGDPTNHLYRHSTKKPLYLVLGFFGWKNGICRDCPSPLWLTQKHLGDQPWCSLSFPLSTTRPEKTSELSAGGSMVAALKVHAGCWGCGRRKRRG